MVSGAVAVAQGLFAALFPSDCRLCGVPLENISRLPVCPACLLAMPPVSGATCEICGDGLASTLSEGAGLQNGGTPLLADFARTGKSQGDLRFSEKGNECLSCQQDIPHFSKATAYGAYDAGLRELIHLLKYERVEPAAGVLARMLAKAIRKLGLKSESVVIIPVPLYRGKRRERGFNQAELIARKALKELAWPEARLLTDVLERVRPTISQIGLTRPQRVENLRGAFRTTHLSRVKGRDVLLVDDVMTTGTTASECARILSKAGAQNVWVATVARTLKNQQAFGIGRQFEAAQAS
jgi:ComF family protein